MAIIFGLTSIYIFFHKTRYRTILSCGNRTKGVAIFAIIALRVVLRSFLLGNVFAVAKATRYNLISIKDFDGNLLGGTKLLSLGRAKRDMQSLSKIERKQYPNKYSESTTTTLSST